MESHELLREVLENKSAKQVADDLNLSLSMVYKWAQPPKESGDGRVDNPLARIEALIQSTNDERIVQWICQRAGGFFIHNPNNLRHPQVLIPATNRIIQEFADLLAVVAAAAADENITLPEAKQIRRRWEDLKSVTEGFVASCENGNFDSISRSLKGK
jgi:transposase